MKRIIVMLSLLAVLITMSACSSKTSYKTEEKTVTPTLNTEKSVTNSYEALDKLPQKYSHELAEKNGDVVNIKGRSSNIEKLDKFIEDYENKKASSGNMVRITKYTNEGDAIICDLIIDGEGIKLIEDTTRDKFSSKEDRKKTEYKISDISKTKKEEGISYIAKTDKGEEKFLFFTNNN
ncbi:DUF4362 domain-containing protein [Clostridium sp. JN-9]|uniref:DUF4362 domain-containing protein n=1 Tax=Clostridium sp. JN-9 TaxID=2507159 RepID=UPI0013E89B8A|nr:DUF4362 domain-containing protein [Clostridium sp. JN-9]